MNERNSQHGFTWVELLVVVAFLATLAAIFFPVFARTHCGLTCSDTLQQLGKAAMMYAADYNDQYPPAGLTCLDPAAPDGSEGCRSGALLMETGDREGEGSRYGYGETWQGGGLVALQPYVKAWRYSWCVKKEGRRPLPTDPRSFYGGFEWLKSPERVAHPATKVLMLEAYSHPDRRPAVRFDEAGYSGLRHTVLFADGHAKPMDLSMGCSGNPSAACKGWESCLGSGGNRAYFCSGFGNGVSVPDFP